VDQVFPLFENPHNLGSLTPAGMGFEILSISDPPMQHGTTIEYRIRPFGVPQRWLTKIVEYEPARSFVDLQKDGPYRYWRHKHTFRDDGGRTLMTDRVEFQMPVGVLGRLAHRLVVDRELRRIFDYRADVIARLFGTYYEREI
jgi:ligand-binding SRPBCC domain-containing protein